jgi:hypothetical protein
MRAFDPVTPLHVLLVLGRLAEVPPFLREHMLRADLERAERAAFLFGETLVLLRASATVGRRPGEIVRGLLGLGFRDAGTRHSALAGGTRGLLVGQVHCERIGTEPCAAVRWRADWTGNDIRADSRRRQHGRADIPRIGESLIRLVLTALAVYGQDRGEAAVVTGNGGLREGGGDDRNVGSPGCRALSGAVSQTCNL